jgi:hypothetical protein
MQKSNTHAFMGAIDITAAAVVVDLFQQRLAVADC